MVTLVTFKIPMRTYGKLRGIPNGLSRSERRQKASAHSQLKLTMEDLDTGLPRVYTPDLYRQKCSILFEHVYESYPERNAGVYA